MYLLFPIIAIFQYLSDEEAVGLGIGLIFLFLLYFLVIVFLIIIPMWKIFSKAGKPGWAAIIPIYNIIVLLEIVGRPLWWIILYLVPCVNIVIMIMIYIDLAKSFGKDTGYGIGIFILPIIFLPMLGYGSAQYVGPAAAPKTPPAPGM
jgi:hypothetical protein